MVGSRANEVALCSPFFVKIRTAGLFPSVALPLGAFRGVVLPSISPRMYVVYANTKYVSMYKIIMYTATPACSRYSTTDNPKPYPKAVGSRLIGSPFSAMT